MRRTPPANEPIPIDPLLLERLASIGPEAPSIAEKTALLQMLRETTPGGSNQLDHFLIERSDALLERLEKAREVHAELRDMLARLRTTPWHPATFLRPVDTAFGPRALVHVGGSARLVGIDTDVDLDDLMIGEEVFLSQDQNAIMTPAGPHRRALGDTGRFDRWLGEDRLVIKWRDEEVVVEAVDGLREAGLQVGDCVRWDRAVGLAYEKLADNDASRFLASEIPNVPRSMLGGQDANVESLLAALTTNLVDAAKAALYGLRSRQSVLLVGPNGVGKTLMARIAAAEVTRLSGRACRVFIVKPSEWEAAYVGETQANIRQCFKALHAAAQDGPAILFLDEVEAVGRIRGDMVGHHSDKFLGALLAELDGFSDRGNVSIIAASNRKDLLDPALLERLSDLELTVRRPDRDGARQFFAIHFPESLPIHFTTNRDTLIDIAVSKLYSPNADNALATLRFRDGKTRVVTARELMSGRTIAQICRIASQTAFLRDVRTGAVGVQVSNIDGAVADTIERLSTTLSPRNVRAYLADLPQDVDVVAVEPVVRRVPRPGRYLAAV